MQKMFGEAWSFNGDLSKWDVSSVKIMYGQDAFRASVAEWLGSSVSAEDVTITCMCDTDSATNAGFTPAGTTCGATAAARGRSLLQAMNVTAVEYEVFMGSVAEQQGVLASAGGEDGS